MQLITKTTYLQFALCSKNAWLQLNKPELRGMFELSDFDKSLVAKGNLVESWAQKLFPEGVLISEYGEKAKDITNKYIQEKTKVIFQPTFISDKFLARNDVLEYDPKNDYWNLYEIKGTNTLDENEKSVDHIEDVAFQVAVLEDVGIKLGEINLIHLNKDYVRGDEINVSELFIKEDIREQVYNRIETTRVKMKQAAELLFNEDENSLKCDCIYLGRSNHCSTFNYSHPYVPEYSVHDIARIGSSKKKLTELIDSKIYDIAEIPENIKLSDIQQIQKDVHISQIPVIDLHSIKNELDSLSYPLYFLDYETYPPAIPLFKGFKPYQQIPFQFSLHFLEGPEEELKHFEYLHTEKSDPSKNMITKLKDFIGSTGSIIVWNKKFEKGINSNLLERHPEDAFFLNDINERIYDLMDIFQKQFYVHPGFKGKTSIKKVLPVLAPALSYQDLEIQEGGAAMEAWYNLVFKESTAEEKALVVKNLLTYCCLDTYAMYVIWKELDSIIQK
jgi:hypothetical protein